MLLPWINFVLIFLLPNGNSYKVEISISPYNARARVLGIGVALKSNKSVFLPLVLRRIL